MDSIKIYKRFIAQAKRKVSLESLKFTKIFVDGLYSDDKKIFNEAEIPLISCTLSESYSTLITTSYFYIRYASIETKVPVSSLIGLSEESYENDLKGSENSSVTLYLELQENRTIQFEFETGQAITALIYCIDVLTK